MSAHEADRLAEPREGWKHGNEFAPFHPSASHIPPDYRDGWNACYRVALAKEPAQAPAPAGQDAQTPKLDEIEQYRMQMAGISTAAFGYWVEGDSIHPDYDTIALRDVAKLYAKYAVLAAPEAPAAQTGGEVDMRAVCEALGFDPTNHHNAAKCPYCRPSTPAAGQQEGDKVDAEPEGWPCEIESADFEANTITVKMMRNDYWVGAGKHVLHPPVQTRQPGASGEGGT